MVSWALAGDTIIYKTEPFSAVTELVFTLFLFMEPRVVSDSLSTQPSRQPLNNQISLRDELRIGQGSPGKQNK